MRVWVKHINTGTNAQMLLRRFSEASPLTMAPYGGLIFHHGSAISWGMPSDNGTLLGLRSSHRTFHVSMSTTCAQPHQLSWCKRTITKSFISSWDFWSQWLFFLVCLVASRKLAHLSLLKFSCVKDFKSFHAKLLAWITGDSSAAAQIICWFPFFALVWPNLHRGVAVMPSRFLQLQRIAVVSFAAWNRNFEGTIVGADGKQRASALQKSKKRFSVWACFVRPWHFTRFRLLR